VEAGADPTLGLAPLRVSFWAYLTGPGAAGAVGTWRWDFGDGTNSTAPYVAHTYKNPGSYTAKVTFTDRDGHTYGDWFTIDVRRPLATVTITAEPNPAFVQSGQTSTEVTYTMSFKNPLSEPPGLWAWHVTIYPVGKKGSMGASFWTSGTSYKLPEDLAVGTYEVLVVVRAGDGGQDVAAGMTTNQVIPVPKSPIPPPSPTPTPGKSTTPPMP
jgi:PKD repeat protein